MRDAVEDQRHGDFTGQHAALALNLRAVVKLHSMALQRGQSIRRRKWAGSGFGHALMIVSQACACLRLRLWFWLQTRLNATGRLKQGGHHGLSQFLKPLRYRRMNKQVAIGRTIDHASLYQGEDFAPDCFARDSSGLRDRQGVARA